MTVSPLGDSAALIAPGPGDAVDAVLTARVHAVADAIARHAPAGVVDIVPAFASVAVFFDLTSAAAGAFETRRAELEAIVALAANSAAPLAVLRTVEIPVCYGGNCGPDLAAVAAQARLGADEIAALHAAGEYLVHAIGFAPGFPYLGGLPPQLATPRRATPRPAVPAGSVGIGGAQTGIYPFETPGGWNLIGRTPLKLFDPAQAEPGLLRVGDRVTFRAIDEAEFRRAREEPKASDDAAFSARGSSQAQHETEAAPRTLRGLQVLRAGMSTTVQDLGRRGYRDRGVPLSGAADAFALRLANLLVGNPEDAAALEFTLVGPELKFLHDTLIALGGGEFGDLPRWRPIPIRAGTTLQLGPARSGCRGYLAVAGGIDVAPVLGSRSTYARAGFGGFRGRALREGDVLSLPVVRRDVRTRWRIDERVLPPYSGAPELRLVRGAPADEFDEAWTNEAFAVSAQSDRMGVRLQGLQGPALKRRGQARELVSSPVAPGTVQAPPDGQPIVLLADAQTIGGYPQIGHIVSVDLPLAAQLRPGDTVRFRFVTLAEAHELLAARERAFALLRQGVAGKVRGSE